MIIPTPSKKILSIAVLVTLLLFPSLSVAKKKKQRYLTDVRYWTAPNHTRAVFDISSPAYYKLKRGTKALSFFIIGTKNKTGLRKIPVFDKLIKYIHLRPVGKNILVNIVLTKSYEKSKAKPHIFKLKKINSKPYRLVVDFHSPVKKKKQKMPATKPGVKKVIAIDPGHGGEDPGAIGRYRHISEKNVVLKIAKLLATEINKDPNFKAILTRNGDYFVPLFKRVKIAEKWGADLFLSIHANASRKKHVRGASVYYLSNRGASNKSAALLARLENRSDTIGGVPHTNNSTVNAILLDIAQTDTLNKSRDLASEILRGISKHKIKCDKRAKYAAFAVLKSPTIPSVLLETAYITNRGDEKLLSNQAFIRSYVKIIAGSIKNYFREFIPNKAIVEAKREKTDNFFVHRVKAGETIWRIASRYSVSPKKIISSNKLSSNRIFVGQKLKIPRVQ